MRLTGPANPGRRALLRVGLEAGGALGVLCALPLVARAAPEPPTAAAPGAAPARAWQVGGYLRLDPDGGVRVYVDKAEMGQGVLTALPMLLADELDCDWQRVRVEMAPADAAFGRMGTGGSSSVRVGGTALRVSGATARQLLVAAAAARWQVPAESLTTAQGQVRNPATGATVDYAQLLADAAALPAPQAVSLKAPVDYRLVGSSPARVDLRPKLDGSARFGMDVRLPGQRTAVVLRCPTWGGRVRRVDGRLAEASAGVRVVNLGDRVGVVADGYWQARKAASLLNIEWAPGPGAQHDDAWMRAQLAAGLDSAGEVVRRTGAQGALADGAGTVEATYRLPFLAHACMEPMNCTAHVQPGRCVVYAPTQSPTATQQAAAKVAKLKPEQVQVYPTYLGGGFGRRALTDFVEDAVALSRAVEAPVQVIWSREDDLQQDAYRPAAWHHLRGRVVNGAIAGWWQRVAAPDGASSARGCTDLPYGVEAQHVEAVAVDLGVPLGPWRSVGYSGGVFVAESFMDELAHAAGADPLAFRGALLAPRERGVLEAVGRLSGWGKPLPAGQGRGVGFTRSFGSLVAQVVEVEADAAGAFVVRRVVCAVDCGLVVHPDLVRAQIEGAVAMALSAAQYEQVSLRSGGAALHNFHDYPVLRMSAMPPVEVHLMPGGGAVGGIGEPGVPALAPALANALFAATGQRRRELPLRAA